MKPIAAPIVGGMITSTIHVLILVPVFFALMKERALRRGTLEAKEEESRSSSGGSYFINGFGRPSVGIAADVGMSEKCEGI